MARSNAAKISARKKLSELYARGAEVRFGPNGAEQGPFDGPPSGDQVAVWITPPSPLQREMALRDANSARAKSLLAVKRSPDSEEALTTQAFIADMDDDTIVEFLLEYDFDNRQSTAIREVLQEDEWEDFGALQDAMRGFDEMGDDLDTEDPGYLAVMEREVAYGKQVSDRMTEIYEADKEALKMLTRASWEKRVAEKRAELVGSQAFITEYERQMCFYSVRDIDNRSELFFESARDYADQADEIRQAVSDALSSFINEVAEAKNSPRAADGSQQLPLPSEPETSEVSIPEAANA